MIEQLFDYGVNKPNAIKKTLDNRPEFNTTIHRFSSNQQSNYLKILKTKRFGKIFRLFAHELRQAIQVEPSIIPDDPNLFLVVN